MNSHPEKLVVACAPDAIAANERKDHFALARRLLGAVGRGAPIENGMAFALPADSLISVAQFVQNERKCCPFMTFEIRVGAAAEPISLRVTGPVGTREFLQAELASITECGCK